MSIKDQKSYKVGYKVGYAIGSGCISFLDFFLDILYDGVVTMSKKYKIFIIIHLFMISGIVSGYILKFEPGYFMLGFFGTALAGGIWNYIIEYPELKKEKQFHAIFEEINLKAMNNSVPDYLFTEETEYKVTYFFSSLIPVSEWEKKKDKLEMYLNKKIIGISQYEEDNRGTLLEVQKKSLPVMIEFDDEQHLNIENDTIFNIGMGYDGLIYLDLNITPHCFVAGTTGSGKSNVLKCLIHQALSKNFDVILIDFKRAVSFSEFSDVVSVYYEHETTKELLRQLVEETKQRLDLFRKAKVDNIDDYKKNVAGQLKRKIVFIDELAELLQVRDKELSNSFYDSLETLTRLARAVGIHLILAIQRPDSTVINGQIKSNVSGRLCGQFADPEPSRIVLGNDMACKLPCVKGRFICKDIYINEVQCFFYKKGSKNAIYRNNPQNVEVKREVLTEKDFKENFEQAEKTVNEIPFDFSDID